MRRYSLPLLLWVLGTAGAGEGPPVVRVAKPLRRQVDNFVFPGLLEPGMQILVRARVSGVVEKINVKPGEIIKAGDCLGELNPGPFLLALERAKARVEREQRDLKGLEEALAKARQLAAQVTPKEIAVQHQQALKKLQTSMELAANLWRGIMAKEPGWKLQPGVDDFSQSLALAVQLNQKSRQDGFDLLLDEELRKLTRSISGLLSLPMAKMLDEKFSMALGEVETQLQTLKVLDRARSKEGIEGLQAERDLQAALIKNAQAEADHAKSDLEGARLLAPGGGLIASLPIKQGDAVDGNPRSATLIGVLVRPDWVRVSFDVDGPTMLYLQRLVKEGKDNLKKISDVPIVLERAKEKGFPIRGTILFAENQVDRRSGLVRLHAKFANPDGALTEDLMASATRPQPVRLRLASAEPREVLLVPAEAVARDEKGQSTVLVVDAKNVVNLKKVILVGPHQGMQALAAGLTADDWVVVGIEKKRPDPRDKNLDPDDFIADIRRGALRPGAEVRPLRIDLSNKK